MNVFDQINRRIALLKPGEHWTLGPSDLFLSRADFLSINAFIQEEAKKGVFSVKVHQNATHDFSCNALTIIKN